MARDEAVLEAVAAGLAPPTLRLYGWRGRWLSIGMAQPVADVDAAAASATGTGLLRRPSGGTAVLHVDQVGWSLALPTGHPLADPDIVASYLAQAAIAVAAMRRLGVAARPVSPETARAHAPDPLLALACFGGLAPHEIVAGDPPRKLIGWGQVRRRGVVMHHSVLSRHFSPAALAGLLVADRTRLTAALAGAVIGLDEARGRPAGDAEVAAAVVDGHAERGLRLTPGQLTPAERRRAAELVETKYAHDGWNRRR